MVKQEVTRVEHPDGHARQEARETKRLENLVVLNAREVKIMEHYKQLQQTYDASLARECYRKVDTLMSDYQNVGEFVGCIRLFEVYKYLIDNDKS